jgi:hypothetical protein
MKKILDFATFINESSINEQAPTKRGVVAYKASASKTRLTPNLAKELGIENDSIYQIDLDTIGRLGNITQSIPKDGKGTNISALLNKGVFGMTIKKIGKTTKPGLDVLTINGTPVTPGPDGVVLTSSDFKGSKNVITAANNGILVLTRLSRAIWDALETSSLRGQKISPELSIDWSIQLSIGGDPLDSGSRGYKYFYAIPGSLDATRNSILNYISAASVRTYKNSDTNLSVTFPDYPRNQDSWWTIRVCKSTEKLTSRPEIINALALDFNKTVNMFRLGLLKENNLVNQNSVDISKEWKDFASKIDSYMNRGFNSGARKEMISLKPEGYKAILDLMVVISSKISDVSAPEGINISPSVLSSLTTITKDGLSFKGSGMIDPSIQSVQRSNAYGPSSQNAGSQGMSAVNQGEGAY